MYHPGGMKIQFNPVCIPRLDILGSTCCFAHTLWFPPDKIKGLQRKGQ